MAGHEPGCARTGGHLRPRKADAGVLCQPLPDLSRAARDRSGQADAERLVFPDPLRRPGCRLQEHQGLLVGQEEGVLAEIRRLPALRAPHHEPRLQRSPRPYPRPPADHGRALAARDRRHGTRPDPAGRPPARCHRRQRQGRPDRRFRRRDPDRGDRQSARCSRGRARALARLVAGHPRRAGAGGQPGGLRPRQQGGEGFPVLPRRAGGAAAGQARQSRPRRADPADSGRRQWRAADRKGTAAQLHLPAQCRPRDHHQSDRQRPGGAVEPCERESSG